MRDRSFCLIQFPTVAMFSFCIKSLRMGIIVGSLEKLLFLHTYYEIHQNNLHHFSNVFFFSFFTIFLLDHDWNAFHANKYKRQIQMVNFTSLIAMTWLRTYGRLKI